MGEGKPFVHSHAKMVPAPEATEQDESDDSRLYNTMLAIVVFAFICALSSLQMIFVG